MSYKVGVVGIALETEVVCGEEDLRVPILYSSGGITDDLRSDLVSMLKQRNILCKDLGELLTIGECEKPDFVHGTSCNMITAFDILKRNSDLIISGIESEAGKVSEFCNDYDLVVFLGPTHLSAILAYGPDDIVVRLDYHSDYLDTGGVGTVIPNYATYMNYIAEHLPLTPVINCFVKEKSSGIYGKDVQSVDNLPFRSVTHYDIDVDVFDPKFQILVKYPYTVGKPRLTPHALIRMIQRSPNIKKIGFWETRKEYDRYGNGLKMMVGAVDAAISAKLSVAD